jgi:hypothetical protein
MVVAVDLAASVGLRRLDSVWMVKGGARVGSVQGSRGWTAVTAAAADSRRPNQHPYYATNDALVWFGCLTRLGSFEILELARDHSKANTHTHALLLSLSHPHSHNPKRLVL